MKQLIVLLLLVKVTTCLATTEDEVLGAYQELNFTKAKSLANKIPNAPKARYIEALMLIYNAKNYNQGLAILQELYQDKTIPKNTWAQIALSYARAAQIMKNRPEVYGEAGKNSNELKIYREIIKASPKSKTACTAMLYQTMPGLFSGNKQDAEEAFKQLESFCNFYKGPKEFLTPLHLLAENRYIFLKNNFQKAIEHLKAAYENGIKNPKDRAEVLYRIGRIYDAKLDNKTEAEKYYSEFLRKYPYSGNTASVKRFLNNIKSK